MLHELLVDLGGIGQLHQQTLLLLVQLLLIQGNWQPEYRLHLHQLLVQFSRRERLEVLQLLLLLLELHCLQLLLQQQIVLILHGLRSNGLLHGYLLLLLHYRLLLLRHHLI